MSSVYLSDSEVRHIYVEVAQGRGKHGDFIRSFADAVLRADPSNFALLKAPAVLLAAKFDLAQYLDTFEVNQ